MRLNQSLGIFDGTLLYDLTGVLEVAYVVDLGSLTSGLIYFSEPVLALILGLDLVLDLVFGLDVETRLLRIRVLWNIDRHGALPVLGLVQIKQDRGPLELLAPLQRVDV